MEVVWLGHATFRVRMGNTTVIMDPFPPSVGLRWPAALATARVVTVSGPDTAPSAVSAVPGGPAVVTLRAPGEFEVDGIAIRGTRTSGPPGPPVPATGRDATAPAWNTAFVLAAEGLTVCHLGNPDKPPTGRQAEAISPCDVLLLAVGSPNGLKASDAAEIVNNMAPRVVVPMLYAHAGDRMLLRPLASFLHELGVTAPEPQPRLTLTRATMPKETQVVVLSPVAAPAS